MKKIVRLTESDLARIVKRVIKENEENSFDFYMEELGEFANKLDWEGLDIEGEEMRYFVDEISQIVHNAKQDDNLSKDQISQIKEFAMDIIGKLSTGNEEMNEEDDHEEKEVRTRKMVRDMEGKTKSNRKEYTGKGRQAPPPPSFKR